MFADHFAEHVTDEEVRRRLTTKSSYAGIACRQTRGSPCPLTKMVLPGGLVVCT